MDDLRNLILQERNELNRTSINWKDESKLKQELNHIKESRDIAQEAVRTRNVLLHQIINILSSKEIMQGYVDSDEARTALLDRLMQVVG